jgi:hypothetical protein
MREEVARRIIGGAIAVIVGLILLLISNTISIPSEYNTFLGIPYSTNPAYFTALLEKIFLLIAGLAVIISGLSVIAFSSLSPSPSPFSHLRPYAPETIAYYERVVMDNFGYICPFCYERGKLAYVYGHKSYLSCKACGARWSLNWVFRWHERIYILAGAKLIQDGTKGTGATLLNKEYPTDFWRKMGLEGGQPPPPPP